MQILALILFLIVMSSLFIRVLSQILHLNLKEQNSLTILLLKGMFSPFKLIFGKVFGIFNFEGFMSIFDKFGLFGGRNKGFVIDGDKKRLSKKASFQNILVTGAVGLGKSTVFIYSNIFTLLKTNKKIA